MNIRQSVWRVLALVVLSSALGGCIILPVPYGHGGGGGHYRR